jgi:Cys-tRNA(Pro) deacylase
VATSDLKYPVTPAIHFLREHGVDFEPHLYPYQERGGTSVSSAALGVDEHQVIKTLVFETDAQQPLIVLMHGDLQVSLKELARLVGTKKIAPCTPEVAHRHSGYQVGGTSPFATKKKMPIYLQESILSLTRIYINGGARGFLVSLASAELTRLLAPTVVNVSKPNKSSI